MNTRNHGFSLIELLIAIAISLVAMLAASEAYLSSRQTYRLQAMQSRLTEDGRFLVSMLQRTISQAGFRQSPTVAIPSDRLSVAANAVTVRFSPDGVNQIACDGSIPAAGVNQILVIQKNGSSIQCTTNAAVTPIDWVAPSTSGSGNGSEVVDFSLLLGIDTGPVTAVNFGCGVDTGTKPRDCVADKYAATLTGTEVAEQITSVRACIVLRTEAKDSSVQKQSAVKNCSSVDILNSQTDNKLYRVYWTTILLKNR